MYEDALARVNLFSGLRKKDLKDLAAYCKERTFSPGSVLLSQGEQGLGLFILTKGTARITRKSSSVGVEEVLGQATAGDVIGEMALLDDLPRSATVTAVDEVTVLLLPVWEFRRILREIFRSDPDVGLSLLAVLSGRVRRAEQRACD
ncbi:Crp/Fnr family transcriptional regulator [Ktedonosporobacter rubrisoli]|nr:cyclic nucleotide-binding domain-containing protein [Ktedonosporobacter rubrisoli]